MRRTLIVFVMVAAGAAAPGVGQCPFGWSGGFVAPGIAGNWGFTSVRALSVLPSKRAPVLFVGGRFNYASELAAQNLARWDGGGWSGMPAPPLAFVYAIAPYDDGIAPALFAGGSGGLFAWDGATWVPAEIAGDIYGLVVFDDGTGPALYAGAYSSNLKTDVMKWDGVTWSALGSGLTSYDHAAVYALAVYDGGSGSGLYAGGHFTKAGGVDAANIAKWNGSAWEGVGGGLSGLFGADVNALVVFDDGRGPALYVGGDFWYAGGVAASGIARWDGQHWSGVGGGTDPWWPYVYALAVYDDGQGAALYAGGEFTTVGDVSANYIAKWDGTRWSALGAGVSSYVYALGVYDSPGPEPAELYVGGDFGAAGEVGASRIAKWNGVRWASLTKGEGLSSAPAALAVYDAPGSGLGPQLYAGGTFEGAGAVAANRMARWDGTKWSAWGAGADADVWAMKAYQPAGQPGAAVLYVGGWFNTIDGVTVNRIARWDGLEWTALGDGLLGADMGGLVRALEVFDHGVGPRLYAGGSKLTDPGGGGYTQPLAYWDGVSWNPVGLQLEIADAWVSALAVFDDGRGPALYVGGYFKKAGGLVVNHIARWDGTSWLALGTGVDHNEVGSEPEVRALAVFDDGTGPALYVGGILDTFGGIPTNGIGRWNGSAWSAVGGGRPGSVHALTVFDEDAAGPDAPALYAGGSGVARWDGTSWSDLGMGTGAVRALAGYDDGGGPALYVGGDFVTAGGNVSAYIAKWSRQCPAGDMNCDGVVNMQDVEHFVQALFDRAGYNADHDGSVYPPCDIRDGDFTSDGVVNNQDIDGFVGTLLGER